MKDRDSFEEIIGENFPDQDDLGALGELGDALERAGFRVANPEDIQSLIEDTREYARRFPYTLSLDGFSVPRPKSWNKNGAHDDPELIPAPSELIARIPENKAHSAQLEQTRFASLAEAVAVGSAFPLHDFYQRFDSVQSDRLRESARSESASIVGLTVVRLLITPDTYESVQNHEDIDSKEIYEINDSHVWGYDFARSLGGTALVEYIPDAKLNVPPLDREEFRELAVVYLGGETAGKMHEHLAETPPTASEEEVNSAMVLLSRVLASQKEDGASDEELDRLRTNLSHRLFPTT